MDVKTDFLNGEEIFMNQAEGCTDPGEENKACRLILCRFKGSF